MFTLQGSGPLGSGPTGHGSGYSVMPSPIGLLHQLPKISIGPNQPIFCLCFKGRSLNSCFDILALWKLLHCKKFYSRKCQKNSHIN